MSFPSLFDTVVPLYMEGGNLKALLTDNDVSCTVNTKRKENERLRKKMKKTIRQSGNTVVMYDYSVCGVETLFLISIFELTYIELRHVPGASYTKLVTLEDRDWLFRFNR